MTDLQRQLPSHTSAHRTAPLARVGARLLSDAVPAPGSPGHRFREWVDTARPSLTRMLDLARADQGLQSTFLVVNFLHPDEGPSGIVTVLALRPGLPHRRAALSRITAIPHSEMDDYPLRWRRGESVVVRTDAMPPRLRLRYVATTVGWSMNIPIFVDGEWVGLVGGTSDGVKPNARAKMAVAAAGDVVVTEYLARRARDAFETMTGRVRLVGKE